MKASRSKQEEMDDLQRMYRALKAKKGKIGLKDFLAEYGRMADKRLKITFGSGSWNKLVESCGGTPQVFANPKADIRRILDDFGLLSREHGRVATGSDWMQKSLKPSVEGLRNGHGVNFGQLASMFLDQRAGEEQWEDVIRLIEAKLGPSSTSRGTVSPPTSVEKTSPKLEPVLKIINGWTPSERYRTEEGYQENLRNWLEKAGHRVRSQRGDSLIDLLVDEKVAVEVKKSPSLAEYDRLFGQIARHCDNYGQVIAVICDVGTADALADFNERLDKWLRASATIRVIQK